MYLLNGFYEKSLCHSNMPVSRLIDALSNKHYRIFVMNETKDSLRCIILRRWRLIGIPWFGPHTRLQVEIVEDSNNFKISYRFFWPEYIFYWLISMLIAIASVLSASVPPKISGILTGFIIFIILASVFSLLVYVDTKFFYDRFRKLSAGF